MTRKRKLSSLRGFCNWCLDHKIIDRDPLSHITLGRSPQKLPHYLNIDEIISYLASLKTDFLNKPHLFRNEFLNFMTLYGCGLRVAESCTIKTQDWNKDKGYILVLGKGRKERLAILPEFANRTLIKHVHSDDPYIYGRAPLNSRTVYNWVKRRGIKAQLHKPVHPHMIRHTYATHLLKGHTDLRHLQELLGHRTLSATERYTHLDREHILKSLEDFHPLSKK